MSERTYTAEDFEQAQFAIDPSEEEPIRQYWVRRNPDATPWDNALGKLRSDELMSRLGCIPVYAEPYSPEALQRAWEHGEKPKPGEFATEGMVTILKGTDTDPYTLCVSGGGDLLLRNERIVYRPVAPKPVPERDPVADLAQALEDALPEEAGSPVALRRYAEALVEHGVRVTDDE